MNYPTPQISRLKKILNYLQYMKFLKIKSKLYKFFFCILSKAERIIYSRKCIFGEILGKFDENHKLFAIYAIPENQIKTIQVFVYYLMQKE